MVRGPALAVSGDSLRPYAIAYGILVAGIGGLVHTAGIKKHFTETYLHIAANVMFLALISGVHDENATWVYFAALLAFAASAIVGGLRFRRFAFVAYGTVYGYIGISMRVLNGTVIDSRIALSYLIVSGVAVVCLMVFVARRFGREE